MINAALSVHGLTKCYNAHSKHPVYAIRNMSFEVKKGELIGLLGPNGAGKTTAVKCITSLVLPTSGEISVFGRDPARHRRHALARMAAVLEGNRNTYWRLSPRENLSFFMGLHGRSARSQATVIDSLLERLDLRSKRNTPVRALSRGMQQKVAIACALAKGADILLLDEPALGLDVASTLEMSALLTELSRVERRTVIISSHNMGLIQGLCERVLILSEGQLLLDERIEDLVSVFEARAYRVEIPCQIPSALAQTLSERYVKVTIEADDQNQSVLVVEFRRGEQLYDLVDQLRRYKLPITSIGRQYPDLKEVFLQTVGRGCGEGSGKE